MVTPIGFKAQLPWAHLRFACSHKSTASYRHGAGRTGGFFATTQWTQNVIKSTPGMREETELELFWHAKGANEYAEVALKEIMESWNIGRRPCREGGRIDRRTAIRRPSQSRYPVSTTIPTIPYSNIPVKLSVGTKKISVGKTLIFFHSATTLLIVQGLLLVLF